MTSVYNDFPKEIEKIIDKIPLLIEEMNNKQLEREEVVNMLILALFAKKHIFFLGEPGVGKTDILNIFATTLEDGKLFETCIKEDTTYEEIFGEYTVDANGKKVYNFDFSIVNSHFAIVDEIWKGNSKTMNSLLSIASGNRVAFIQGFGKVPSPLIMIGAASNEMPQDSSLDALSDRFVIKMVVDRIRKKENWIRFINKDYDRDPVVKTKFTPDEINFFASFAEEYGKMDEQMVEIYHTIKKRALKIELKMSDRRLGYSRDLLITSAVLNKRKYVDLSDFFILLYTMWSDVHEIKEVKKIVFETIFGVTDEVVRLYNQCENRFDEINIYVKDVYASVFKHRKEYANEEDYLEDMKKIQLLEKAFLDLKDNIESILNHYDYNKRVEKMIEENIVLVNHKTHVYAAFDISRARRLYEKTNNVLEFLQKFENENETLFMYNENKETLVA